MTLSLTEQDALNRKRLETRDFDMNFLVSAGAGAGKTYTIVERVFNMLVDPDTGIRPQDIVMITFTIKAATEMKTRLNEKLRDELDRSEDPERKALVSRLIGSLPEMQISTIHSFCRRILNDYPLESGVGFAPKYDREEGDLNTADEMWFEKAWNRGLCPECLRLGIKKDAAWKMMSDLSGHPTAVPQYLNPDIEENQSLFDRTMQESRRIIRGLCQSMGEVNPDLLNSLLRDAYLSGEELTDDLAVAAARLIGKNAKDLYWWMGQKAGKMPHKATETLRSLLDVREDTDEDLEKMAALLVKGDGLGKDARRSTILQESGMLSEGYRLAARITEDMPDIEELTELAGDIDRMIHGIVSHEIYRLKQRYAEERRINHQVNHSDSLIRTADLVRDYPAVRQELHDKYKVFFVDEYQDTNPVQTDIIFGIAADVYDKDWRKSVPAPGRLFLVGDAKQGIFRFTGADIALWHEAETFICNNGGEVVVLSRNHRSTPEICTSVSEAFGPGKEMALTGSKYQVGYQEMAAYRNSGPEPVLHHIIPCFEKDNEDPNLNPYQVAAEQVARYIRYRVDREGKAYGDFLVLSYYRETHNEYSDAFRKYGIPAKIDAKMSISRFQPILLMNLRVQAVCHPLDERYSFRALCECGNVKPQEWDSFRLDVKQLPPETRLTVYRDTRSLMDHTEELSRLLPDTEKNARILKALQMLNEDRVMSQDLLPCAFLDRMAEKSEGLFREPYDSEEYRNQYAALRHVIDKIRADQPQQFDEMAEILQSVVTASMDRMPTVRADSNFVRLMNLHKVKGLQGKIVIFLPGFVTRVDPDYTVERDGASSKGWFVLKTKGGKSTTYNPPDWDVHKKEESEFVKAERIRLKYVALTRAEDEIHFFEFMTDDAHKQAPGYAWRGFEDLGRRGEDVFSETEETDPENYERFVETVRSKQQDVLVGVSYVKECYSARKTPSAIDKEAEEDESVRVRTALEESDNSDEGIETVPGGRDWGTAVHRAAELVVTEGTFTEESIRAAAVQGVIEQFESELLNRKERMNLQLPDGMVKLEEIRSWLAEQIALRLSFMQDESSDFRQSLKNAEVYTELPFVISLNPADGSVYDRLILCMNVKPGKRVEANGKIDLALRYPDGTWMIVDYKTDRMLPTDQGSKEAFRARLQREYGSQLEIYRIVLEYLTGERVKETKILSV